MSWHLYKFGFWVRFNLFSKKRAGPGLAAGWGGPAIFSECNRYRKTLHIGKLRLEILRAIP
jgi:hypothetical protein